MISAGDLWWVRGASVDEQLKKRLLGAVVLLSIAVLLIPLFFGPSSEVPEVPLVGQGQDPPPKPPVAMDEAIADLPPLETPSALPGTTPIDTLPQDFPITQTDIPPIASVRPATQAKPTAKVEPLVKPKTQAASTVKAEKPKPLATKPKVAPERLAKLSPQDEVSTKAARDPKVARAAKTVPRDPASASWAVQVGSFSDKIKADILRRELQVRRFPAFVLTAQVDGKLMYRVRVGPELERNKAVRLRDRLAQDMSLTGNVVGHR